MEWISFACVLIRKEVIASIGPMDEGFFMYFEDVDYCLRARSAGWQIAYAPAARVVHLRGGRTPDAFAVEERGGAPRIITGHAHGTWPDTTVRPVRRGPICIGLSGRGVSLAREVLGNKSPHTAGCEAADIWKGSLCGFGRSHKITTHDSLD